MKTRTALFQHRSCPQATWAWFASAVIASLVLCGDPISADEPVSKTEDPSRATKSGLEQARSYVLKVECLDKHGQMPPSVLSAVALDDKGYLLTVGLRELGDRQLCVKDCDGKRYEARWIAADEQTGLTLLKVQPGIVRAPKFIKELPEIGATVIVVGNPFGLSHSISYGNISGLQRSVSVSGNTQRGLIQFTAPVFPGDSGGLLADRSGQMIGIVSRGLGEPSTESASDRRVSGIGFAIPASEVRVVAQRLRDGTNVKHGYLGVTGEDAESGGVRVVAVVDPSPAQSAGIQIGDVIVTVNDVAVKGFEELASRVEHLPPESEVVLRIRRVDNEITAKAKLGERKALGSSLRGFAAPAGVERLGPAFSGGIREFFGIDGWRKNGPIALGPDGILLGVQTQAVTEGLAKSLSLSSTRGALINSVVPHSPAEKAGLRASDLIVSMDNQPVDTPQRMHELIQEAGPGAKLRLGFVRDGKSQEVETTLASQWNGPDSGEPGAWRWGPTSIVVSEQGGRRMEAVEDRVRLLEKRLAELEKRLQEINDRSLESKAKP